MALRRLFLIGLGRNLLPNTAGDISLLRQDLQYSHTLSSQSHHSGRKVIIRLPQVSKWLAYGSRQGMSLLVQECFHDLTSQRHNGFDSGILKVKAMIKVHLILLWREVARDSRMQH
ncbi:hypothetical protein N665_0188s0279 [Sinapis alba]|nr:hypothetical protein N665_0188s0279 [Sinapis alba]